MKIISSILVINNFKNYFIQEEAGVAFRDERHIGPVSRHDAGTPVGHGRLRWRGGQF